MMNCCENLSPRAKKCAHILFGLLLAGLMLSSFAFAFSHFMKGWQAREQSEQTRKISVTGEGKVSVKPDIAVFTASVVTDAAKVKDAQDKNAERSNKILGFFKEKGVAEKDLKTINYSVYPQYQTKRKPCILLYPPVPCYEESATYIDSYRVTHTIEVKVRDLGKLDDLLDGAVATGANEVGSVSFKLDNEDAVKAEARKKAIEDAKAKAKVLAKDLRIKLDEIAGFSESEAFMPYYEGMTKYGMGGGVSAAAPSPQIATGEQEITSQVTITYQFRKSFFR